MFYGTNASDQNHADEFAVFSHALKKLNEQGFILCGFIAAHESHLGETAVVGTDILTKISNNNPDEAYKIIKGLMAINMSSGETETEIVAINKNPFINEN